MDAFGKRAALLAFLPAVLDQVHKQKKQVASGQVGLFAEDDAKQILSDVLPDVPEIDQSQLLAYEKELLGFYLTMHPLEPYRKQLSTLSLTSIADINVNRVGERVNIGGIVVNVKKITTKASNHEMAFVKLEDLTGIIEIVVFPKVYARTMDYWQMDQIVSVGGKIDEKDDRLTILIDDANLLSAQTHSEV